MGISFKISKRGKKFKPKSLIQDSTLAIQDVDNSVKTSTLPSKTESNGRDEEAVGLSGSSLSSERHHNAAEDEVSFVLNLYPDGYSISKPSENDSGIHPGFQEGSKILHPYDRASEGLFTAIESGRLPGSILDDIPCKYVEGALTCEVRDYRKCISDSRSNISSNGSATIRKVRLKMSLENVVKDIPLIADDSWTYGDLMEVESRILKALQPKLCLDPEPKFERLCKSPISVKLDMGLSGSRRRRLRQIPEVTVTTNTRPHGKKICIDRAAEGSNYRIGEVGPTSGDMISQHAQDNMAAQGLVGNQRIMHDPAMNAPGASPAGNNMHISYGDSMTTGVLGKIEGQEAQLSQYPNASKRARLGPDGVHHQQVGPVMDGLQGTDVQWRNQLAQHQQPNARGIQYPHNGMQRYTQLVGEGITNQDGVKLEKMDPNTVKNDVQMMEAEGGYMDPRLQQRFQQHQLMRPGSQQVGWNIHGQQVEKDVKKEEQFSKRKSIQSPRLGTGASAQSSLTMKPTEMSCGSMGTPYGAAASLGQFQRDKSGVGSIPAGVRSTSITSSGNDSMQLQNQTQLGAKRRSNSLPKTPIISGVGSPASVNTMGGPMNASSPSVSTSYISEQNMLEKFAKIEMVAMRHQLNCKKNKVDGFARKPRTFSSQASQQLQFCLTNAWNYECTKDEISTSMSKSLVGGSMNVTKIRVVTVQSQENMLPIRTRLIMSEKPSDGTVAMHYGELEIQDCLNVEDHLPALPNTHMADLLATQFGALMIREGYFIDDQVQPRPTLNNVPSNTQANAPAVTPSTSGVDMQQCPESVSGPQTSMETKPNIYNTSVNATQNILPSSGMLPPGNSQGVQMSQAHMPGVSMPARPQQMDPQQPLQQQQQPQQQLPLQNQQSLMQHQQQPAQFQRSSLMLPTNSMAQLNALGSGSNLPLGNHMGNKPNPLQILQQQPQQQQQQPHQQAQMQRRMMMGLGPTMSMGNIGNNVVSLGSLGNVMGISAGRGISGAGISAPMGAISGIGTNMGQNPINLSPANAISQQLRAGNLTQHQQAVIAQRFKYLQSRGMFAGTQSGMPAISGVGARQMQPGSSGLSMLGQTLNRGNISPMQQRTMGQMGMTRLMSGMNVPMNQQQFQLQQQQLQQQQQPQQLQQQMQQQEATSPLQAVVSPQQVGSPSTLVMPQQMNSVSTITQQQASPQQMGQRTPMSPPLSSGPMHPMSAGNPEACPASPALSSQTLGSVGSITNSPMDLHGVNKSNSVTNT